MTLFEMRDKRCLMRLLIVVWMSLCSSVSLAGTFCQDMSISNVRVESNGNVRISYSRSDAGISVSDVLVCNVNQSLGLWNAASCKALHSEVVAARLSGRTTHIGFADTGSCGRPNASNLSGVLDYLTLN